MLRSFFSLLLLLLLGGCQRATPEPPLLPLPTLTALPTRTATPAPTPTPTLLALERPRGPAPCNEARQRSALREGERSAPLPTPNHCTTLEFALDETGLHFEGVARVTLRNPSPDAWPDLLFRLYPNAPRLFGGRVALLHLYVNGTEVVGEQALDDGSGLRVPLAEPLAPGATVAVEFAFVGTLPRAPLPSELYGVLARHEHSVALASWYPMLAPWQAGVGWQAQSVPAWGDAVSSESGWIEATLSAPARFELAVTGTIVAHAERDGRRSYQLVTGPSRDMAMLWLEGYQSLMIRVDGTALRSWHRADDADAALVAMEAARSALLLYGARFGPYPFEELELVALPLQNFDGMEYPQLLLLSDAMYGSARSEAGRAAFGALVAHEVAHQWWYNVVGNDVTAAPWQDEGLATWSAVLWEEAQRGPQWASQRWGAAARGFAAAPHLRELSIGLASDAYPDRATYQYATYERAALFLHLLRERLGDARFFAALQRYYQDNRFALAPPGALLDSFEAPGGQPLDRLYAEWGAR